MGKLREQHHLLRACIDAVPVEQSPDTEYRSRMVYGDLTPAAIAADNLGLPRVKQAAHAVALWVAERSTMPCGYWRELTVRANRAGVVQLKLILQAPPTAALAARAQCTTEEAALEEAATVLAADATWQGERLAFERHVCTAIGSDTSALFQLALGTARPVKHAPCISLFGERRLLEHHGPSAAYLVGPETLSQVNPATASVLVRHVSWWLGVLSDASASASGGAADPRPGSTAAAVAAAAAAAAVVRAASDALVLGRDINLFGPALLAPTAHTLHTVTHCPCAHADVHANAERLLAASHEGAGGGVASGAGGLGRVRAHFCAKGAPTAALLRTLGASTAFGFAIVSAGRRGIGRHVCAALRELRSVNALVYVSCCEGTLVDDLAELLAGDGGFAVADAARYDHFPCTGFMGGAFLLLRRPSALILPVGPAGSGKSSLCAALPARLPAGSVTVVERDALFGASRASGGGVTASKRYAHARATEELCAAAASGRVCVFDSCNASLDARVAWTRLLRPAILLVVSYEPDATDDHRALLLERTCARSSHPTFPSDETEQAACVDATMAVMQWPESAAEQLAHGQFRCGQGVEEVAGSRIATLVSVLRCNPFAAGCLDELGAADRVDSEYAARLSQQRDAQVHAVLEHLFTSIFWLVDAPSVNWQMADEADRPPLPLLLRIEPVEVQADRRRRATTETVSRERVFLTIVDRHARFSL